MSKDERTETNPIDATLPGRVGKYLPVRCIARGGMGTVYEVEHVNTGERLALKLLHGGARLDAQAIERFRREARVSSIVKSQHVVRVVDADVAPELDNAPYLVMELLEGGNLAEVTRREPQPIERVVDWLEQIARALDKAHAIGIVHRDLKPENLFVVRGEGDDGDTVKVLDFGVAKIRESEEANKTASGAVVGTPLYMAPEQATADASKIGPATDVWAIGLIAYRLLSGRDYWAGASVAHVLAQIVYEPLEAPSARGMDHGAAFDAWFARSCNRDPEARFATAGAQVAALRTALLELDDARTTSAPSAAPSATTTRKRRDPWLLIGLAGAVTAAIALVASFSDRDTRHASRPDPTPATSTVLASPPAISTSIERATTTVPSSESTASVAVAPSVQPASNGSSASRVRLRDAAAPAPRGSGGLDPLADQH